MVQAEQGWVWVTKFGAQAGVCRTHVTGQMGRWGHADCCFHPGLDQQLCREHHMDSLPHSALNTRKQKSDFVAGPPPVLTVASTMSLRKLLSCYRLEAGWECSV